MYKCWALCDIVIVQQFLEKMAESVREGIEKAALDLAKENQEKLMQEVKYHQNVC